MVDKFGRKYILTVQGNDGSDIIITDPITIEFSISRNTMASLNSMQISIKNLAETTRNNIFQDRFNISHYKSITLQAGYGNLSKVFAGNVLKAYSNRVGTDIITYIEARDGGFAQYNKTNTTIQAGTSVNEAVSQLITTLPNVSKGTISEIDGTFRTPAVLDENTMDLINKYSQNTFFVDLETAHILKDNDALQGDIALINTDTGLLGTPKREDTFLEFEMIFEPTLILGQVLEIQSEIQKQYNGQYKVIGVNHTGIISEAVAGKLTTKVSLLLGSKVFGGFNVKSN